MDLSLTGRQNRLFLKSNFAIFTGDSNTIVDHCWFRGDLMDLLTMAWNDVKSKISGK